MKDNIDRILNGESIRQVLTDIDFTYGEEIVEEDELFEMAKLTKDRAKVAITGEIPELIYFSNRQGKHGPRVKFYGGSKETYYTDDAPSYTFGVDGPGRVELQSRKMNKKNCKNAFDPECLQQVRDFIQNHLALLLLTWFNKIDDSEVLLYFQGYISFEELLKKIDVAEDLKDKILSCKTEKDLYICGKELDLYKF